MGELPHSFHGSFFSGNPQTAFRQTTEEDENPSTPMVEKGPSDSCLESTKFHGLLSVCARARAAKAKAFNLVCFGGGEDSASC